MVGQTKHYGKTNQSVEKYYIHAAAIAGVCTNTTKDEKPKRKDRHLLETATPHPTHGHQVCC